MDHEAARRALEWAGVEQRSEGPSATIHATLVLREIVAPLDVVDEVLEALEGGRGSRPPTPWLQAMAGRSVSPWAVDDEEQVTFRGRACCADVIRRIEERVRRQLHRPPLVFECPTCHAEFEIAIGTVREPVG